MRQPAIGGGAGGHRCRGDHGAFGINFDNFYNNTGAGEINSDFSQFYKQGNVWNQGTSFDTANAHDNLEDGNWHDVIIVWNATTKTLSYSVDGVSIDSKTYDVVATDWGGNANGYFGFTAKTGGASNQQQVEIVSVRTNNVVNVAENSANGTVVATASAIDPDRTGAVTYSLTDSASGRFAVHSTTGVVTVANGSLLNHEANTSHAIVVRATDQGGLTFDKTLTISVSNVNEGPAFGNVVLDYVTFGGQSSVTYTNAAGTALGDRSIAVDATGSYIVNVTASSAGTSTLHYAGFNQKDIDGNYIGSQNYYQVAGTQEVQLAQALNPGDTQMVLTNASSWYNGASAYQRNFLWGGYSDSTGYYYDASYSRNVAADWNIGMWAQSGIVGNTVTLNTAWTGPALAAGTTVRDTQSSGTYSYNILSNQSVATTPTLYSGTIVGTSSATSLSNSEFRPGTAYVQGMILPNYTNGSGVSSTWSNMTIEATDTKLAAIENSVAGTLVGTVLATDTDAGDTLTFSLVNNAGGRFNIHSTTGAITVANNNSLDRETAVSHSIVVRVTDLGGAFVDRTYSVDVKDVNEAPTNAGVVGTTNLVSNSSIETDTTGWTISGNVARSSTAASTGSYGFGFSGGNSANTGVISTTIATTIGQAYTVSYDLGGYGSTFTQLVKAEAIGATTLATEYSNDKGSTPATFARQYFTFVADSTSTTLRFSDISTVTNSVDLYIDNVQAQTLTTTSPTMSIAENAANGTSVGTVAAIDRDQYGSVTYSLTNSASGRFAINSTSGVVTVANGTLLDYDTTASHTIVVRTTDQAGVTFDKTMTINLTNVNEGPTASEFDRSYHWGRKHCGLQRDARQLLHIGHDKLHLGRCDGQRTIQLSRWRVWHVG
jgi:hypothetical protein